MPGGVHPPLSVIDSWPKPSPNPQHRGWEGFVAMMVLYPICLIVVGLRLRARLFTYRNAGVDDACIVIAMIFLLPMSIMVAGGTKFWGFDRHVWDLSPAEAVLTRKFVMAIEALYLIASGFTKISILLFYRRMSGGSFSPVFHWMVRITIAWVVLSTVAFEMALFLSCHPLNAFWNQVDIFWILSHGQEGVNYTCYNEGAENLAATGVSMVQDFLTCFMPITLFWKLQLPLRQKVALAAIFFVGIFTCISAVFRFYYAYETFYQTYDVTWVANRALMWLGVETHLGVICASAPALKVYFKKYFSISQITYSLSTFRSARRSATTRGGNTLRTSDEKSVVAKTDVSYDYHGTTNFSRKTRNTSVHEIDLERLDSRGGIAITCDIEIASEHEISMPSSPMSPKEMLYNGSSHVKAFTPTRQSPTRQSPTTMMMVNSATQTPIAPWTNNAMSGSASNGTRYPYDDQYH